MVMKKCEAYIMVPVCMMFYLVFQTNMLTEYLTAQDTNEALNTFKEINAPKKWVATFASVRLLKIIIQKLAMSYY